MNMSDDELQDLAFAAERELDRARDRGEISQANNWEVIRHAAQQIVILRHRKPKGSG